MGPIIFFFVSLAFLLIVTALLLREKKRPCAAYRRVQKALDARVLAARRAFVSFLHTLPRHRDARNVLQIIAHTIVHTIARVAGAVERGAHRLAHSIAKMEGSADANGGSRYMREIKRHKEQIGETARNGLQ